MKLKEYLFSLKKLIIVSSLIFILFGFLGYFTSGTPYLENEEAIERMREMFEPFFELSSFGQFLFIAINNAITLFLSIILGLAFGIFPLLVLLSNGMMLGIVAYLTPFSVLVRGILPHGILEIPALIVSCAIGLKLGKIIFLKIKKVKVNIKKELKIALLFFLKFLLPVIIIAAAIEAYITPLFLQI